MSEEYSPYTPLYHPKLDDWGLAEGTRVWMADGGFEPVESLEKDDLVYGVSYEKVEEAIEGQRGPRAIRRVWRPKLIGRRVLGIRTVEARAWQLTFGSHDEKFEARRLVAGGETEVRLDPPHPMQVRKKRMVDCYTSVPNPRVETQIRDGRVLDPERSSVNGPALKESPLTGTPQGDLVMIMPFDAHGGQNGLFNTRVRKYNKYVFSQAREVEVLADKLTLVQLLVQPDTVPEAGIINGVKPRANIVAQTPFAPEEEERIYISDPQSNSLSGLGDVEGMEGWDEYVQGMDPDQGTQQNKGTKKKTTVKKQGAFYETLGNDEYKSKHNIDGWLNGGIVIPVPVQQEFYDKVAKRYRKQKKQQQKQQSK